MGPVLITIASIFDQVSEPDKVLDILVIDCGGQLYFDCYRAAIEPHDYQVDLVVPILM